MPASSHPQLIGALGDWLGAHGAESSRRLSVATRLVLSGSLLGIGLDDVDAPELSILDQDESALVDEVRLWAIEQAEAAAQRAEEAERVEAERQAAEAERVEIARLRAEALRSAERAAATRSPISAAVAHHADTDGAEHGKPRSHDIASAAGSVAAADPVGPGAAAGHNIWLAESRPEPGKDPATRRRLRRQELFWWAVCLLALVALGVQLLL